MFWPRGMWDLSSSTRDWTCTPRIRRWSLNHWTAPEVPQVIILIHVLMITVLLLNFKKHKDRESFSPRWIMIQRFSLFLSDALFAIFSWDSSSHMMYFWHWRMEEVIKFKNIESFPFLSFGTLQFLPSKPSITVRLGLDESRPFFCILGERRLEMGDGGEELALLLNHSS